MSICADCVDYELDLVVLGVDRNHQRRGAGKQLLRWGLDRAAEEGQKVFVISTPDGKPLYDAHGFKDLGSFDVGGGFMHYSMLWMPPAN